MTAEEVSRLEADYKIKVANMLIMPFIEACCEQTPTAKTRAIVLYEAYKKWSQSMGIIDPLSQRGFGGYMRKLFMTRSTRPVKYVGLALKLKETR
jgi:phage/plasmid-associated DNA primase